MGILENTGVRRGGGWSGDSWEYSFQGWFWQGRERVVGERILGFAFDAEWKQFFIMSTRDHVAVFESGHGRRRVL